MGKMKGSIPKDYVCSNYCEDICLECQYEMETLNIYKLYKPSLERWYSKITRKG